MSASFRTHFSTRVSRIMAYSYVIVIVVKLCACVPLTSTSSAQAEGFKCDTGKMYDSAMDACCRVCNPGYGVALPCVQSNDTVCSPCVDGRTYSASVSYEESCQPCSLCPSSSQIVHKCNATHNTKCQCNIGFYYYAEQKMCRLCDRCSPGEKAEPPCSPFQNTVCKPCPANHFSSETSSTLTCKLCSTCPSDQRVKSECVPHHDTICEDINASSDGNDVSTSGDNGHNLIPLYCAPFAAIFLSLIGYVVIKRWKLCCAAPSKSFSSGKHSASSSSTKPLVQKCTMSQGPPDFKKNNNSVRQQEMKPMLAVANDPLIASLPVELFSRLEHLLNDADPTLNDWKALARCFGYSESQIMRFEADSAKSHVLAAKLFFRDLCRSSISYTVAQLCENCTKICRDDCAAIVRGAVYCKNADVVAPVQFI